MENHIADMKINFLYRWRTYQFIPINLLAISINNAKVIKNADRGATDNVGCWGWHIGKNLRSQGKNVLIFERAYLGNRSASVSLGWNGLNGHANFYNDDVSDDRWNKYWKSGMGEWKGDSGDYALLCGQVFGDASMFDCDNYGKWILQTLDSLKRRYGKVAFRAHPKFDMKAAGIVIPTWVEVIDPLKTTLGDNLRDARLCVSWSSNATVLSFYSGVPSLTFSRGSMIRDYVRDDVFAEPDRNDWGRKIAYCQWSKRELFDGTAWRHISRGMR